MHITLLNQYYAPDEAATAQFLADLGAGLAAAGHLVTAVCGDRSYANSSLRYSRRDRIDGVDIRRARVSGFGRASAIGRLADYGTFILGAIVHLLRCPKPGVVVSLSTPPFIALIGSIAARVRGAKSIFWSMDVYPDLAFELGVLRRNSLVGGVARFISTSIIARSDAVVALGETMAKRLRMAGAKNVKVVPNWADEWSSNGTRNPFRTQWGWDGWFVVLYSGNLGLAHEFETVLEAAKMLEKDGDTEAERAGTDAQRNQGEGGERDVQDCPGGAPRVLFAFVGGGPQLEATKRRAEELGLRNVEFRDYVRRADLGKSLTAGDVHLVTMREGMAGLLVPSKIYGILAAARPVCYVGPAEGEIYDVVREGRCGARIANGDAASLVEEIRAYRADADRCRRHGANGRKLFERHFTREQGIRNFLDVIDSVTAPDGPSSGGPLKLAAGHPPGCSDLRIH